MQNLTFALVQANQIWEDKNANLKHYEDVLHKLEPVDLILLPEMFHTGFSMNAMELAEDLSDSMAKKWLENMSKKCNAAIYTSMIVKENGSFFNRGVFQFPDGTSQFYDKRKTFGLAGEDIIYTSGQQAVIINYKSWKINLQICYDLRFPEISRNKMVDDKASYDLCLYVANWPEKRIEHWNTLVKARAIENQCYILACNRVGIDGKELHYNGCSAMIDPLGKVEMASPNQETVLIGAINAQHLNEIRSQLPFLKDQD